MSMTNTGVWAANVWASTVWADGVWYEQGAPVGLDMTGGTATIFLFLSWS